MQPFEMGDQLRLTGPTAQVETEHLIGAFVVARPTHRLISRLAIRAT